jgi:hypothetical protein
MVGWILLALYAIHLALLPFMVLDLSRRHPIRLLVGRSRDDTPRRWISIVWWYIALTPTPVLTEVLWLFVRSSDAGKARTAQPERQG